MVGFGFSQGQEIPPEFAYEEAPGLAASKLYKHLR